MDSTAAKPSRKRKNSDMAASRGEVPPMVKKRKRTLKPKPAIAMSTTSPQPPSPLPLSHQSPPLTTFTTLPTASSPQPSSRRPKAPPLTTLPTLPTASSPQQASRKPKAPPLTTLPTLTTASSPQQSSRKPKAPPKKRSVKKTPPSENGGVQVASTSTQSTASTSSTSVGTSTSTSSTSTGRGKGGKARGGEEDAASTEPLASTSTGTNTGTSTEPSSQVRTRKKAFYLKPVHSSWKTHIASFLVHRCVSQARSRDVDPRLHFNDINWGLLSADLLSPDNLRMLWFYIAKEYPKASLAEISEALKPYSALSLEQFAREEIKQKYKDQIPRPPLSAFMLFCKSKGPKLKEKHPELAQREMASKLGKKWRSMGEEKKDKYHSQYTTLRQDYREKLRQFYDDHPDAKPPPPGQRTRSKGKASSRELTLTPDEKRLKELKVEMPRALPTPYFLFCKAKREKVHRKHPDMASKDVTIKLAKKWNSMGLEKKGKYKKAYEDNMHVYRQQMEEFYKRNPDAKELLTRSRRKNKTTSTGVAAATTSNTSTQTSEPASPNSSPPPLLLPTHEDREDPLLPTHHSEEEEEEGEEGIGEEGMDEEGEGEEEGIGEEGEEEEEGIGEEGEEEEGVEGEEEEEEGVGEAAGVEESESEDEVPLIDSSGDSSSSDSD